jgi:4-hydroxythreonine-4-phosphate dehydrogenase
MVKLLALTMGDRYGVGPELVAGAVELLPRAPWLRVVVVGDRRVFDRARAALDLTIDYPIVLTLEAARGSKDGWMLLDRPFQAPIGPFGGVTKAAGSEGFGNLTWLTERLASHRLDALVHGPLNPECLALAGLVDGDIARMMRHHLQLEGADVEAAVARGEPRAVLPLGSAVPVATTRGGVAYELAGTGRAGPEELLAAIGVVVRMLDAGGD